MEMATRSIPFQFDCWAGADIKKSIVFNRDIPDCLVTLGCPVFQQNATLSQLFTKEIEDAIIHHFEACNAACAPSCKCCGSAATNTLHEPQSFLFLPTGPFVGIGVYPVCERKGCNDQIRQEIQERRNAGIGLAFQRDSTGCLPCKVCGTAYGTRKCGRCLAVAYCGKQHQREDWPTHKGGCVEKAAVSNVPTREGIQTGGMTGSRDIAAESCSIPGDNVDSNPDVSITYSGLVDVSALGEPTRYREFSKEEI